MTGVADNMRAYRQVMGQRGLELEVHERMSQTRWEIHSTSPFGEGVVYIEPSGTHPWVAVPPTMDSGGLFRVSYAGDGDWVRIAAEAGLDGILVAMLRRWTVLVPLEDAHEVFGDLGHVSPEVAITVQPMTHDQPVLDTTYLVRVYMNGVTIPDAYIRAPFGVADLADLAKRILLYSGLQGPTFRCGAPDCGLVEHGLAGSAGSKARVSSLALLKSGLCDHHLYESLELAQGAPLAVKPKGWND